jgi:hypothetical protein
MTYCLVNHHRTGHLVFVLVSAEWVMICPAIDNYTSCEICAVICFLHVKNMSAAEVHCELCMAYGQNVITERTVRQWCRMFKKWANKCSRWRAMWSAICSDWWACSDCWPKYLWKNFYVNFHKFLTLFSMRLSQARLSQVLCNMGSENVHGCAQNTENGFGFCRLFESDTTKMAMNFSVTSYK